MTSQHVEIVRKIVMQTVDKKLSLVGPMEKTGRRIVLSEPQYCFLSQEANRIVRKGGPWEWEVTNKPLLLSFEDLDRRTSGVPRKSDTLALNRSSLPGPSCDDNTVVHNRATDLATFPTTTKQASCPYPSLWVFSLYTVLTLKIEAACSSTMLVGFCVSSSGDQDIVSKQDTF
jgi:hypothetical protein